MMLGPMRRRVFETLQFVAIMAGIDLPVALTYGNLAGLSISPLYADILVLEGAVMLIVYGLSASRILRAQYVKKIENPAKEPENPHSARKRIIIPRGISLLLSAAILIVLGFLLDTIARL